MSPWEPGPRLLGNLYIIILGTLTTFTWKTWEPCREPWRNLEGTFWEPFGNLEGTLRNLGNLEGTLGTLGTFTWEPGNLYLGPWEPLLGNLGTFTWDPGNLYLGTFTWEPGNLYLGTFTWDPGNLYLGTFTWEPLLGNLGTFTWNLGTLGEWVLELLRSAPKPLLWLKTPKHSAVGEKLWLDHPKIWFWPTEGWKFQQNKSSIGILGRTGEWEFVMIPIARSLAWTAPIDSTAATDGAKWTSIKSGIALKPKTDWLVRP